MTPAEIAAEVVRRIERPDLQETALLAVRSALLKAHSIAFFVRDKTYTDTPAVGGQSYLELTLPPRFRKTAAIQSLDVSGNVIVDEFKKRGIKKQLNDYFGFRYTNTYLEAGSQIRVDWGSSVIDSTSVATIRHWYWAFPTFGLDPEEVEPTYISNSWILEEFPDIVIVYICLLLTGDTDDDTQHAKFAREFDRLGRELVMNFQVEAVPE